MMSNLAGEPMPRKRGTTLLKRRLADRKTAVERLLAECEILKVCHANEGADIRTRVMDVFRAAWSAGVACAQVQDLEDVERYGPRGGR